MTFISSSEAKNAYFMGGEASRDETNGTIIPKIGIFFLAYSIYRGSYMGAHVLINLSK